MILYPYRVCLYLIYCVRKKSQDGLRSAIWIYGLLGQSFIQVHHPERNYGSSANTE